MAEIAAPLAPPIEGKALRRAAAGRGYFEATWYRLRRDRTTLAAALVLVIVIMTSVFAPTISDRVLRADPYTPDLLNRYMPPSNAHPLGTDDLGRDVLARQLQGGRVSLTVGLMIAVTTILIGLPVGLASGYFGRRFDDISNAVIQTLSNVPRFFLLILLSVTFRPGVLVLAFIIGGLGWMGMARLVRGQALAIRERDYVAAARAMGANDVRILSRHVFPNVFSVITVESGFTMASGILIESGLSYLGLGVQVPVASWGNMLNGALENVTRAVWLVISPGFMIFVTVLCIFLIADGLRDALDPRLKA